MNTQNNLQLVTPILKDYSIRPHFVENIGKVTKVYGDKGVFALKKILPQRGTDFIRHIQYLFQRGYNRIVPVYPTVDGRYAVIHENNLYYLMPWLSNEIKDDRNERHQQMFRELARLHTLSVQEVKINKEEKSKHYEKTIHEWEKQAEFIEGYLEECESKWYMSPFELLFCLYYQDINQSLLFSRKQLKAWYEGTKDEEKARAVLSHGKISTEHFIYNDKGYGHFINFEQSRQGSPLFDLLPFLSRNLNTFPKRSEECVDWIYTYLKFFPLKEGEMQLLLSYFAHPAPIIKVVETHFRTSQANDERMNVQELQKQYWLLKNIEYVVMRINEIEIQKKQQAEAEAQAQEQSETQS